MKLSKLICYLITPLLILSSCVGAENSSSSTSRSEETTSQDTSVPEEIENISNTKFEANYFNNEKIDNVVDYEDLEDEKVLTDVSASFEFKIYSSISITNSNLYMYCKVLDTEENMVELGIKPWNDYYIVYKNGLYEAGTAYDVYLSTGVYFHDYGRSVKHLKLLIDGEEKNECVYDSDVKQVNETVYDKDKITEAGEGVYQVIIDNVSGLHVDDVVKLQNTEEEDETTFYKITSIEPNGDDGYKLLLKEPNINDVYERLDTYKEAYLPLKAEYITRETEEDIAEEMLRNGSIGRALMSAKNTKSFNIAAFIRGAKPKFKPGDVKLENDGDTGRVSISFGFSIVFTNPDYPNFKIGVPVNIQLAIRVISSSKVKATGISINETFITEQVISLGVYASTGSEMGRYANDVASGEKKLLDTFDDANISPEDDVGFGILKNFEDRFHIGFNDEEETAMWEGMDDKSNVEYTNRLVLCDIPLTSLFQPANINFVLYFTPFFGVGVDFGANLTISASQVQNYTINSKGVLSKAKLSFAGSKEFECRFGAVLVGKVVGQIAFEAGFTFFITGTRKWFHLDLLAEFNIRVELMGVLYASINLSRDTTFTGFAAVRIWFGIGFKVKATMHIWKFDLDYNLLNKTIPIFEFGPSKIPVKFVRNDENVHTLSGHDTLRELGLYDVLCFNIKDFSCLNSTLDKSEFKVEVVGKPQNISYKSSKDQIDVILETKHAEIRFKITWAPKNKWCTYNLSREVTVVYEPVDKPAPSYEYLETIFELDESLDGYVLTKYSGKDKEITIPEEYSGKRVVKIGDQAFQNNKYIERINLSSVEIIGEESFRGCSSLKTISWPKVKKIGKRAFYGDGELRITSLPDKLTVIPEGAFYWCQSITELDLKNVASIGKEGIDLYNFDSITLNTNTLKTLEANSLTNYLHLRMVKIEGDALPSFDLSSMFLGSGCHIVYVVKDELLKQYKEKYPRISENFSNGGITPDGKFIYDIDNSGGIQLVKHIGDEENVIVPEKYSLGEGNEAHYVTTINTGCFDSVLIKSITLPRTITKINKYGIKCTNISELRLEHAEGDTIPHIHSQWFQTQSKKISIIVKKGMKTVFINDDYWNFYKFYIQEGEF